MMTTYGTLEHLEGSDTEWRYKGAGGELATKQFNYCEVLGNQFKFRHQVEDNKSWHHYLISVERTWATKYMPNRCHAYFLALTKVNTNDPKWYLVNRVDMKHQLDFWRHLVWEMVENKPDE